LSGLEKHLAGIRASIDKKLDRYLPSGREGPAVIHRAMRYSVLGSGKRIRPILAIEASKACGGTAGDVMPVACALELVHAYSLVHDDLPAMDDDDYRRGRPSCHKVFGEANAILAGDALLTLAFGIIAKYAKPKTGIPAIGELAEAIGTKGMVGGQVIDLEYKDRDKSEKVLDNINRLKTSRLFEASARLGAIAAAADPEKTASLTRFGKFFGLAFQAVDDLMDGDSCPGGAEGVRGRREAGLLMEEGKRAIDIFGRKGRMLKDIADHILHRKR